MVAQTYIGEVTPEIHQVKSNLGKTYTCYLSRNIKPQNLVKGDKVDVIWGKNHRGKNTPYIDKVII